MQSSPHAFDSDTTDHNPSSFSRFYHHPNDRMLFDAMPFGPAGYRPDISFSTHSPFPPRPNQVPIKRMDSNSPSPTCQPADGHPQRQNTEPVVYNIPIRVEGRDDVSPSASPAAPVREIPPERRPQSPQYQRAEQQIPIHVNDGTGARQLRPGATTSRQRSVTPDFKRQDEGVRTIPVQAETLKPRERSASPPPAPKKKKTPQEQIQEADERLKELRADVDQFMGTSTDKQYRYLDEVLTRLLISLDTVDTEGDEQLRQARKHTIRSIQQCADVLESKASSSADQQTAVAQDSDLQQSETDAESSKQQSDQTPGAVIKAEEPNSEQAMDTETSARSESVISDETGSHAELETPQTESTDSHL